MSEWFPMMNWWYYGGGPMAGFGFFFMFLWWAFIVVLIVAAIRWLRHGSEHRPRWRDGGSALDILEERFAKGEINEKEYKERRKVLEKE